jgi:DNA-binding GntR family transcriptional regulator
MTTLSPGTPPPNGAVTKAEAAYRELRLRIMDGGLSPGSSINQERLAADLGLSVTPLREALRRLEGEGFVDLDAHKIVKVMPLSRRELTELCVTRARIDPLAASLAADQATAEEQQRIIDLAAQISSADLHESLESHRAFHHTIYAAAHNKVLEGILNQLWVHTDRYRLILLRNDSFRNSSLKEHKRIARAIKNRNSSLAADLMDKHVNSSLRMAQRVEPTSGLFLDEG